MTFRKRAVLSSALVALPVAFALCFFDPEFPPGIPWDELKDMPYHKALDRIAMHQIDTQGLTTFVSQFSNPRFWQNLMVLWAALATTCFAACSLTQWRRKAP